MGVPLQEPPPATKSGSLSTEAPELELRIASRAGSEKQTADEALEAARKRIDLPWVLGMITYMISLYGIYVAWFVILLSIANAVRGTDFLVIQYRSKSRPVVPGRTGSQLPPWLLIADTLTSSVMGH